MSVLSLLGLIEYITFFFYFYSWNTYKILISLPNITLGCASNCCLSSKPDKKEFIYSLTLTDVVPLSQYLVDTFTRLYAQETDTWKSCNVAPLEIK